MGLTKKSRDQIAKQGSGHSIQSYWMTGVLGLLVLVAAAWTAGYFLDRKEKLADQRLHTKAVAQTLAEGFSAGIQQQIELIRGLSRQVGSSALLELGDSDRLRLEQQRLTDLVPDALQVRLLPVGFSEPDKSLSPHLGYASLQLLRKAESNDQMPPAELHQFGTANQHLAIASAMRGSDGKISGIIHAAFPATGFKKILDAVGDSAGCIEWQQVIPGKPPLTLAGTGGKAAAGAKPDGVITIPGSIWQIAYWSGSAGGAADSLQIGMRVAPGVLLFLFAALLMFVLAKQMAKAVKTDQHSILSLVEALVVGRPPKAQSARLSDLQPTLDVVAHQIKEYRSAQAGKTATKRVVPVESEPELGISVEEDVAPVKEQAAPDLPIRSVDISPVIFRAYDIRGIVGKELTEDAVAVLGQGFGSEVYELGHNTVVVGRDARTSSESLQSALIRGLQASGRDVIDLGLVPTPLLYFAAHELEADCGVIVTGSHNPAQYNGLKMVVGKESPSPEAIQNLRRRIDADQLLVGEGTFDSRDIIEDYIERVLSDVRLGQTLKIVVDCGNGASAVVAPELYRQLGCEVVELYCDIDGDFPNHHPDPGNPDNMADLQKAVLEHQAALGLAFDGDGDRLGVVDSSGNIIWPDRLLMYLAIDVLTREPGGDIIYDVKSSRHLANIVLSNGGRPLMWKSGHSMLKAKMKESHALLAGEFSGHIIFSERWYGFDDGVYAGARLLEILSLDYRTSAEVFAELPESVSTPEFVLRLDEGYSETVMEAIDALPDMPGARMVKIDGLRAEFEQGWGLVRASNTSPALLFRFEADSEEGLEKVQSVFRDMLKKIDPKLKLPF